MRRNFLHKEVFLYFQVFVSLSNSVRYRFLIIFTWLNLLMYWAESIRSVTWAVKRQPPPFLWARTEQPRSSEPSFVRRGETSRLLSYREALDIFLFANRDTHTNAQRKLREIKLQDHCFPQWSSHLFFFSLSLVMCFLLHNSMESSMWPQQHSVSSQSTAKFLRSGHSNSTRAVTIDY